MNTHLKTGTQISAAQASHLRGQKNYVMASLKVVAFAVGMIPVIGLVSFPISWGIDRIVNNSEANKELKLRSKYYAEQIGTTLGMDPNRVTVQDFKKAAEINPALKRLYDEPINKQKKENRTSSLINGAAIASVGIVNPAVAHGGKAIIDGFKGTLSFASMAKSTAGSLAGGALGSALSKETVNSQELIEALEKGLADADAKGIAREQAINPQLIFMLRVSQDELLAKQIKTQFGTALHKMTPEQINGVMAAMPALAASSQREAYAIAKGIAPIRDLAATAPNLQGSFAGPMVERSNGTHLQRLQAQRGMAVNDNDTVANDNGPMSNAERIRMQQATRAANQGVTA